MNHLSLFSGIGGIDLAAEWAGFTTVAFCEQDKFCQKVLAKHWPGIPIFDDVKTLDGKQFSGITLLSGGFPCQPFSEAGQQRGRDDDRYLWPQMLRISEESRPAWICAENVTGIINMALAEVLSSLEAIGYEGQAISIPACAQRLDHVRERVFILAHAKSEYEQPSIQKRISQVPEQGTFELSQNRGCSLRSGLPRTNGRQTHERGLARVCNEFPNRVDRLKALGNAVAPKQIYPILKAIADYELSNISAPSNSIRGST